MELVCECPICGHEKKYKTKCGFIRCKNKPCRSCSNSISRGGNGNISPIDGIKNCIKCGPQPTNNFYFYKNKNRYHSLCFNCKKETFKIYQKEIGRYKKYNMTKEQYYKIYIQQSAGCAICEKTDFGNLFIDHDHKTQKVRGLLCRDCNNGLGLFKDDIRILSNAISYITQRSN